jgi:two-component system response regulator AtoC
LQGYHYPGNVRELENMVERAVILAERTELEPGDFGLPAAQPAGHSRNGEGGRNRSGAAGEEPQSLRELEREAIIAALERHEGRRAKTAEELGITRRTLLNKIKEYGLDASS